MRTYIRIFITSHTAARIRFHSGFAFMAAFFLIFQLSSCSGGGGDGGGGSSSSSGATTYRSEDVANAAVSNLGNQAAVAVLTAYDKGYSLRQIVEAVMANNLSQSGDISGQSPELTPQGFITRSIGADVQNNRKILDVGNTSARTWVDIAEERNTVVTVSILVWASEGYSVEQIIQMIVFVDWDQCPSVNCLDGLTAAEDSVGEPELEAQPGVIDDSSTGDGGTDTGGDTDGGDGCFLNETTILGTWTQPRVDIRSGLWVDPCTWTFQEGGTVLRVCETPFGTSTGSILWSLDCNTLMLGLTPATVTSASSIEFIGVEGVTVPLTR